MKIMMVSQGYPTERYPMNGIHQFAYAKALKKRGIDVFVVALDVRSIRRKRKLGYEELTVQGIRTYALNIPLGRMDHRIIGKVTSWCLKRIFPKIVKKEGMPDIIHSHFTEPSYATAIFNKEYGIPYIISEHASSINKDSKEEIGKIRYDSAYFSYHNCDKVIVGSPFFQRRLQKNFDIEPICIPTITNTDYFEPGDSTKEYYKVVSVGNLKQTKGHREVIKGFADAFKDDSCRLFIFGSGEDKQYLKNLIKDIQCEDRVFLMGQKTLSEIGEEFKDASLFVLASHSETYGKAYIEAMKAGLPVITTNNGGSEHFIRDFNGIIVEKNSAQSLTNAFKLMYDRRKDYDKQKISKFVVDNFSEEAATNQLINFYKTLIKR